MKTIILKEPIFPFDVGKCINLTITDPDTGEEVQISGVVSFAEPETDKEFCMRCGTCPGLQVGESCSKLETWKNKK